MTGYILLLILLVLWQGLCGLEVIPTNLLPSPLNITLGLKDLLIIGMLVIGLIGYLINGSLRACEKEIVKWRN